jgi:MFS family permease
LRGVQGMSQAKPVLNVNLRWFLLAMILANVASQMAYSLLSIYLIQMGASVSQVGLVFTVASLVPMALQILGGWLSDTIGPAAPDYRSNRAGSTANGMGRT